MKKIRKIRILDLCGPVRSLATVCSAWQSVMGGDYNKAYLFGQWVNTLLQRRGVSAILATSTCVSRLGPYSSLTAWPPGCSPLVLPPSQQVGIALERRSAWLVLVTQVKACFRETHSRRRASKIYGHNAFQIIHMLSTVVTHTLLKTAHTVGSDCGYNPGWCRSHHTVSEMT